MTPATLLTPPPFLRVWRPHSSPQLELVLAHEGRYHAPAHIHDELELSVAPLHARELWVGRTRHTVPPGAVSAVMPGEAHRTQAAAGAGRFYSLRVQPQLLAEVWAVIGPGGAALPRLPVVHTKAALAAALLRLHRQSGHAPGLDALALDLQLRGVLAQLLGSQMDRAASLPPGPRGIQAARARLDDAPGEAVSLAQLAEAANLSPFHFARVFRVSTGLSPHAYLLNARVRRAKTLLLQGEALPQLALSLGFASQSHFAQVFRQRVGVTPAAYRQDSTNLVDRERL